MDVFPCENEAEVITEHISSNLSFNSMQSFDTNHLITSIAAKQELSKHIEVYSSINIFFSTNEIYYKIMKNDFSLIFKIKYPEEFFDKIRNKTYYTIYGIELNTNILTCFGVIEINTNEGIILALGVNKEHQNKRLGSKLLQKIIEELTNLGIIKVSLIVQVNNYIAIKLYSNFGFEIVKEIDNYYKEFDKESRKAFMMKKILVKRNFWVYNVFRKITDKVFMKSS